MNDRVKLLLLWILLALPIVMAGSLVGWLVARSVQEHVIITAIVFASSYLVIACCFYYFSDKLLLRWYHAKKVQDETLPFYEIAHRLAVTAEVPAPKLYIVDSEMPNAFVIGRNAGHASIVVTNALLDLLDTEELEAVLAHELAHLKNGDTLVGTIVAVVSGALTALATFAFWGAIFTGFGQEDDPAPNLIKIFVTALVAPVSAVIIQLMVAQSREYVADEESVRLIRKPHKLISVLEKLEQKLKSGSFDVNPSHVHLFFMNPLRDDEITVMDFRLPTYHMLFHTQPSAHDRINSLHVLQSREREEGYYRKQKMEKDI